MLRQRGLQFVPVFIGERGLRNYDALMAAVQRAGSAIAPATLRELRDAALADEHGSKLQAALARHALA